MQHYTSLIDHSPFLLPPEQITSQIRKFIYAFKGFMIEANLFSSISPTFPICCTFKHSNILQPTFNPTTSLVHPHPHPSFKNNPLHLIAVKII